MRLLLFIFILLFTFKTKGQTPKNGTYTYTVAYHWLNGTSNGATCTIVIKGDSIKVFNDGSPGIFGKKGELLCLGIIMKHKKTGKYIIAFKKSDADAPEINNCDGPNIIDFKNKLLWRC